MSTTEATHSTRYEAARQIVENHQATLVEGVLLDVFTASVMVQVFDALSPERRAKFDKTGTLEQLAEICLSIAAR